MKMVHLIVGCAERRQLPVLPSSALESEDTASCGFHSGGNCRTETIPHVLMAHLETSASCPPPQVDTSWNIRRS